MAEKKMKCYGLDNDCGSGTGTEEHRGKQESDLNQVPQSIPAALSSPSGGAKKSAEFSAFFTL